MYPRYAFEEAPVPGHRYTKMMQVYVSFDPLNNILLERRYTLKEAVHKSQLNNSMKQQSNKNQPNSKSSHLQINTSPNQIISKSTNLQIRNLQRLTDDSQPLINLFFGYA